MRLALAIFAVALLGTGTAQAADPVFTRVPIAPGGAVVAPDDTIITLRATASVGPKFPGSDELSFSGVPGIEFRKASEAPRFSAPDDGFDFAVYQTDTLRIGPVARYRGGRYTGDDRRHLIGLDDVRWTVEPGVFVEYWAAPWLRARAELRHGIRSYEGFVSDLGVDVVHRTGPFTIAVGPRLTLGDNNFNDTLFSITPRESAINGILSPFRARGAFAAPGAAALLDYRLSETWSAGVFGNYRRIVGDAADSPIVRIVGSPNQFEVGVSVSYSFRSPW